MKIRDLGGIIITGFLFFGLFGQTSEAQESGEGIVGTIDKGRRSPVVTFSHSVSEGNTKILVDAHVPNEKYQEYPIKFEFYVNRHLFSTQIRSLELPGAIGIDIPSQVAAPPLNFSIVATLLHPNRQFVTIVQGAVFPQDLATTLNCSLSLQSVSVATPSGDQEETEGTETYEAENVTINQTTSSGISFQFEGKSEEDELQQVTGGLTLAEDNTLSGTLTVGSGDTATEVTVSGAVTTETDSKTLTSFNVASADGGTSLSCDKSEVDELEEALF